MKTTALTIVVPSEIVALPDLALVERIALSAIAERPACSNASLARLLGFHAHRRNSGSNRSDAGWQAAWRRRTKRRHNGYVLGRIAIGQPGRRPVFGCAGQPAGNIYDSQSEPGNTVVFQNGDSIGELINSHQPFR
jgi:hypothetical protein